MRLCVVLLLVSSLQVLYAVAIDDDAAIADTLRDDDDTDADGSGEQSQSEISWVRYVRNGDVHIATVEEVELLQRYLSTRPSIFGAGPKARLETHVGEQMEDGPDKLDTVARANPRPTATREGDEVPMAGTILDTVASANFYPAFAIGLLENGCTAFLIGPRHAVTTAHCVYDSATGAFSPDLDMWRGRNQANYLDHMEWSEVIMPNKYYVSAEEGFDFALIIFTKQTTSPVWLKMGYSEDIYNIPYTEIGYLASKPFGVMYETVCRSLTEGADNQTSDGDQLLRIQCGSDECFDGGPLLRGYNFQRSKMPVVYGLTLGGDSYSYTHNNIVFQPDVFWSLCFFMTQKGFDARCALNTK